MTPRTFITALAAVVVIAGAILLITGISAVTVAGETLSCGTALQPSYVVGEMHSDATPGGGFTAFTPLTSVPVACADAVSTRRIWGYGLLALGGAGLVGGFGVRTQKSQTTPVADSEKPSDVES